MADRRALGYLEVGSAGWRVDGLTLELHRRSEVVAIDSDTISELWLAPGGFEFIGGVVGIGLTDGSEIPAPTIPPRHLDEVRTLLGRGFVENLHRLYARPCDDASLMPDSDVISRDEACTWLGGVDAKRLIRRGTLSAAVRADGTGGVTVESVRREHRRRIGEALGIES